MKNLNIIIQREYLTRVKKKSFIILTLFMPFMFAMLIFAPMLLSDIKDSDSKRIVVVDQTGLYKKALNNYENYVFEFPSDSNSETIANKPQEGIFAILQITNNLSQNPTAASLYSEKQAPATLISHIDRSLSEAIKQEKLQELSLSANVDQETLQSIQQILVSNRININSIKWDKDGNETKSSAQIAIVVAMVASFLIYMFVTSHGAMVMNGVIEEKSNRIVEVMISSVRPFDLMLGKIIGIGLVGLTQITIWGIIMAVVIPNLQAIISPGEESSLSETIHLLQSVNWIEILLCFLVYFIGGYLIYASLFAMFGSTIDNPQDAQQFMLPVTLLLIFALYAGMYSLNNPDGPLAFWTSFIPFTSPVVMVVRVAFGVPIEQLLISIAILFVSVFVMIKIAAKIYRTGILMYGKKSSLKEIWKWIFVK